ncbi:hypothetical protein BpHYR1_034400 [Brachionus plicatilis]|uniref:Uncharacterized protein n=1 Tax=Brachionus plicatilis TaxID=10195 RepID=A0A3M7SVF7_BRAPC|nr:hypothetical protein BpHYR1_034400 [Brachionus plicatilis]
MTSTPYFTVVKRMMNLFENGFDLKPENSILEAVSAKSGIETVFTFCTFLEKQHKYLHNSSSLTKNSFQINFV